MLSAVFLELELFVMFDILKVTKTKIPIKSNHRPTSIRGNWSTPHPWALTKKHQFREKRDRKSENFPENIDYSQERYWLFAGKIEISVNGMTGNPTGKYWLFAGKIEISVNGITRKSNRISLWKLIPATHELDSYDLEDYFFFDFLAAAFWAASFTAAAFVFCWTGASSTMAIRGYPSLPPLFSIIWPSFYILANIRLEQGGKGSDIRGLSQYHMNRVEQRYGRYMASLFVFMSWSSITCIYISGQYFPEEMILISCGNDYTFLWKIHHFLWKFIISSGN